MHAGFFVAAPNLCPPIGTAEAPQLVDARAGSARETSGATLPGANGAASTPCCASSASKAA